MIDDDLIKKVIAEIKNIPFSETNARAEMLALSTDANLTSILNRLGTADFTDITDAEIKTLAKLVTYGNYFVLLLHENDQSVPRIKNGAFPTLREKQYLTPVVNTLNWFSDHVLSSIAVSNNLLNFFRACDLSSLFGHLVYPTASNGIDLYQGYVKAKQMLVRDKDTFYFVPANKTKEANYFEHFLHNVDPKTKQKIYPELSMRREIEEKSVLAAQGFSANQIFFTLKVVFGSDQIRNIINGVYNKEALREKYQNEDAEYALQIDYVDKFDLQSSLSFLTDSSDGSIGVAERLQMTFIALGKLYALYYSLENESALKEISETGDLQIKSFKSSWITSDRSTFSMPLCWLQGVSLRFKPYDKEWKDVTSNAAINLQDIGISEFDLDETRFKQKMLSHYDYLWGYWTKKINARVNAINRERAGVTSDVKINEELRRKINDVTKKLIYQFVLSINDGLTLISNEEIIRAVEKQEFIPNKSIKFDNVSKSYSRRHISLNPDVIDNNAIANEKFAKLYQEKQKIWASNGESKLWGELKDVGLDDQLVAAEQSQRKKKTL